MAEKARSNHVLLGPATGQDISVHKDGMCSLKCGVGPKNAQEVEERGKSRRDKKLSWNQERFEGKKRLN